MQYRGYDLFGRNLFYNGESCYDLRDENQGRSRWRGYFVCNPFDVDVVDAFFKNRRCDAIFDSILLFHIPIKLQRVEDSNLRSLTACLVSGEVHSATLPTLLFAVSPANRKGCLSTRQHLTMLFRVWGRANLRP